MPELPEVETVARELDQQIMGQTIAGFETVWPRHLAGLEPSAVEQGIVGRCVTRVWRRGKYVVMDLDDGQHLLVHLKMSGQLLVMPGESNRDRHDHTIIRFQDGRHLRFRDTRKFGRLYLVADLQEVVGHLGPEPLAPSFTPARFHAMLVGRKRVVKPLLLDQSFVAGIGNIYADEALHHARLSPFRRSDSLTSAESSALHAGIILALEKGIERQGASIDDYRRPDGSQGAMQLALVAYGREDQPCNRCGRKIRRVLLGGRSTHFCPGCQI